MIFSLAILPSIALLIYVYRMDKKEKEPMRMLLGLFGIGVFSILPIVIIEDMIDACVLAVTVEGSVANAILEGFIVAALTEEGFKYLFLKMKTWHSREFNCVYDGIVYAVFVSLGFATFENLMYVMDGGISTAILRMFTSVPGHTCFAIFMGYYYSISKVAIQNNDYKSYKKCKKRALWIPVLAHGIYDSLIMTNDEIAGENVTIIAFLVWIVFIVILFKRAFKLVKVASANDTYIFYSDDNTRMSAKDYIASMKSKAPRRWRCKCGKYCYGNFCEECGSARE